LDRIHSRRRDEPSRVTPRQWYDPEVVASMPRCCAEINNPKTHKTAVFVAVDSDDEAAGKDLARDAAQAAYGALNASDPDRHPDTPDVDVFTDEERRPS